MSQRETPEAEDDVYTCAGCDAKVNTEDDVHIGWAFDADGEMFCAFCVGVVGADDIVRITDGTLRRHAVKRPAVESLTLICLCGEEMSPLVHRQHQAREVAAGLVAARYRKADPARDAELRAEALTKAALAVDYLNINVRGFDESWDRGYRQALKDAAYAVRDLRAALTEAGDES